MFLLLRAIASPAVSERSQGRSMIVGDFETGYMVFPASDEVRGLIETRAAALGVSAR